MLRCPGIAAYPPDYLNQYAGRQPGLVFAIMQRAFRKPHHLLAVA